MVAGKSYLLFSLPNFGFELRSEDLATPAPIFRCGICAPRIGPGPPTGMYWTPIRRVLTDDSLSSLAKTSGAIPRFPLLIAGGPSSARIRLWPLQEARVFREVFRMGAERNLSSRSRLRLERLLPQVSTCRRGHFQPVIQVLKTNGDARPCFRPPVGEPPLLEILLRVHSALANKSSLLRSATVAVTAPDWNAWLQSKRKASELIPATRYVAFWEKRRRAVCKRTAESVSKPRPSRLPLGRRDAKAASLLKLDLIPFFFIQTSSEATGAKQTKTTPPALLKGNRSSHT